MTAYFLHGGPQKTDYDRRVPNLYELTWVSAERMPLLGNAIVSQKRHRITGDVAVMETKLRSLQNDPSYVKDTGNLRRLIDTTTLAAEAYWPGYRYKRDRYRWLNAEIAKSEANLEKIPTNEYSLKRLEVLKNEVEELKAAGIKAPPDGVDPVKERLMRMVKEQK